MTRSGRVTVGSPTVIRPPRPLASRPLKAWLYQVRAFPLSGTAAASLQAAHRDWRERGADIWDASLLSFEGDDAAADRLGLSTLARLPAELQAAVLEGGPIPQK